MTTENTALDTAFWRDVVGEEVAAEADQWQGRITSAVNNAVSTAGAGLRAMKEKMPHGSFEQWWRDLGFTDSKQVSDLMAASLAVALAEQAADQHRRRLTLWWLSATIALGVAFLGLKGYEYYMEYRAGLVPFLDQPFAFSGPDPHNAMLFYNFYFAITGLHALHMIIGLMVLLVMLVLTYRWREGARVARQVRIAGLYWAFVDIVWVLVYCSLYLLGR